jgi:uncharacterized protein involved in exopolysaccharide biosynthesis
MNDDSRDALSLRSLLTIIFRRKQLILGSLAVCVITAACISFLMTPVYKATSTILLEKETHTEKAALLRVDQPRTQDSYDWVKAELTIIKSYLVAVCAFQALQNDSLAAAESVEMMPADGLQVEGKIKEFQEGLTVQGGSNSNLVELSYEHESPQFAAKVVNQIIETYIKHRSKISKDSEAYQFFESQLVEAGERLKQLEAQQFEFKQNQEVLSPEQQNNILLNQLANFQNTLTEVRTRRISKQARLDVIKNRMDNGEEINIPATETSDSPSRERYIAKLKGDLLNFELELNQMNQRFAKRYSDVVQLERQIREIKLQIAKETDQIMQSEETAVQTLFAEEKELEAAIEKIKRQMRHFSKKEFEYNQISRGINDSEEVYSMLLKHREEARISLAKLENEIKIKKISPAIMGKDPIRPRKKFYIALSIVFGTVIGMAFSFLLEYFDHTVNTPEELERYTGITTLSSFAEFTVPVSIQKN